MAHVGDMLACLLEASGVTHVFGQPEGRPPRSTTASRAGPGSSTSWSATSARERTPRTRTPG